MMTTMVMTLMMPIGMLPEEKALEMLKKFNLLKIKLRGMGMMFQNLVKLMAVQKENR